MDDIHREDSELRKRAESSLDECLQDILQRKLFQNGHIEDAITRMHVRISQDELEHIRKRLEQTFTSDILCGLFDGDRHEYYETRDTLSYKSGAETENLLRDINSLRFHHFSYQHFDEGERKGEGHIYVNVPEQAYRDERFDSAMLSELAHHLLHTQRPETDSAVSEFYDFALSWWREPQGDFLLSCGCVDLQIDYLFTEAWETGEMELFSFVESVKKKVGERPGGASSLRNFINQVVGFSSSDRILSGHLLDYSQILLSRFHDSYHTQARALAWEALTEIEAMTGHPLATEESHEFLTRAVVNALYDEDVDFTDKRQYLDDLKERLPKYLEDGS